MGKATERMIDFATEIAEVLGLSSDFGEISDNGNDFYEVREFISDNESDYYDAKEL